MGNLTSSTHFNDLILTTLNGDQEAKNLKAERKNVLLEQKNNQETLKQKLGSYRAKMASEGVAGVSDGVAKGLLEETEEQNKALADSFNRKLKAKTRANRQKALLAAGDLIKSASVGFAQK